MSAWRQARAIGVLPGTVTLLVPGLILILGDGPDIGWGFAGAAAALPVLLGVTIYAAGFSIWLWTVRLLARIGKGTLAPWDPTSRLVVAGPYRYVRNPMITAVITALLGEAALFGSPDIAIWAGIFFVFNYLGFLVYEEPGLVRRFGDAYREYKRNVPRWIPRRSPWQPPQ